MSAIRFRRCNRAASGASLNPAADVGMAVVGSSGHAARVAAPVIAQTEGARLVGVLGSSLERGRQLAKQYEGCTAYAGWEELASDRLVDAVWIASPNSQHATVAAACLRAGKHVLVEKPMATQQHAAEELKALAEASGLTLTVGFQHRFRPGHEWIRSAIQDGFVGAVGVVRIHRYWPFPYYAGMPADPSQSWRTSLKESGGWVLTDIGSHLVDLALWLVDEGLSLTFARTTNLKFHDASSEDTAVLLLESESGGLIVIETSNAMASFPGTIEVHGMAGWIRADGTFDGGGSVLTHTGERTVFPDVSSHDVYVESLRDFLSAVAGAPARGATAAEGAANVAIIERAARAHAP